MTIRDLWRKRQEQWKIFESWRESQDPARVTSPEQGLAWAQTVKDLVGGRELPVPKVSDYEGVARLHRAYAVLSRKA
jgi:hypothetical protein